MTSKRGMGITHGCGIAYRITRLGTTSLTGMLKCFSKDTIDVPGNSLEE